MSLSPKISESILIKYEFFYLSGKSRKIKNYQNLLLRIILYKHKIKLLFY